MRRFALSSLVVCGVVVGVLLCSARGRLNLAQEVPRQNAAVREPDVVFVPTPNDVVDDMLWMARLTRGDIVYDLGCGDGRIVVAAAKRYGCKAHGFDIDPERVRESIDNVKKNRLEHLIRIEQKDIFELDLTPASVVTLYLLPELNVKLVPQLQRLRPGTRVVSHDFDIEGYKPDRILYLTSKEDQMEHTVFLWTIPLKKEELQEENNADAAAEPVE